MNKILNFITEGERSELLEWATEMRPMLEPNGASPHRFFRRLREMTTNALVGKVADRVLSRYGIADDIVEEGELGSLLSWQTEGAAVHSHTDFNSYARHFRFNLFLSTPESGGIPIYNGEEIDIEEGMLIPYEADIHAHSSTPVVGSKPRIIISYGWLFKNVVPNA